MNFFTKKMAVLTTVLMALGFANTASACEDPDMCVGTVDGFVVQSFAGFKGYGASLAEGDSVANLIEKSGGSSTEITANVAGDGCDINCDTVDITATLNAFENVKVLTAAFGEQSGVPVMAVNEGEVAAIVGFSNTRFSSGSQ